MLVVRYPTPELPWGLIYLIPEMPATSHSTSGVRQNLKSEDLESSSAQSAVSPFYGIAVNGRLLPNTAPLRLDAANRPLRAWPSGTYRVRPGTVWVASTYGRGSYDSRYIGPVEEKSIRGRLRPLWLLHS
ncbi:MAG: S26 family signal peptidase [Bryobacterales bacterium]|nr:S26 family signal peptidase [Bryobacterales bacterium]